MFPFHVHPVGSFIGCCVRVCVSLCVFCLPGCWTNSREIILPQSPSLSGQSDEELVIFNTAGGGCSSITEAKLPVGECRSPSCSSLGFLPLCICFRCGIPATGSGGAGGFARQTICSWKNVEINWTGPIMDGYKATEEAMQTQLGLRVGSVRVPGRGQVIKAATVRVPDVPAYSLSHLCLT